jgi:hypothetical protein
MKLLILNGPPDPRSGHNPVYRGTERSHPSHCDSLPDEHEINKLFFWFLKEGGELGVVRDLHKAKRFCELWNARLSKKDCFEVIEVTDEGQKPEGDGEFLGFDLSSGHNNSLLRWGLRQLPAMNQLSAPIRERAEAISRQYAPQLNAQGLFQAVEVASLCLRSMAALQILSPNLFAGGTLEDFRPIGLYGPVARQNSGTDR